MSFASAKSVHAWGAREDNAWTSQVNYGKSKDRHITCRPIRNLIFFCRTILEINGIWAWLTCQIHTNCTLKTKRLKKIHMHSVHVIQWSYMHVKKIACTGARVHPGNSKPACTRKLTFYLPREIIP